jgi:hypothetical protein
MHPRPAIGLVIDRIRMHAAKMPANWLWVMSHLAGRSFKFVMISARLSGNCAEVTFRHAW